MKIVHTSNFTDSFIQIPIEAKNKYPQIVYAGAGQYLIPCKDGVLVAQSKRVPIPKTK